MRKNRSSWLSGHTVILSGSLCETVRLFIVVLELSGWLLTASNVSNQQHNAVKAGIEKFGKIDVLVNNAGYGAYGPLEAFPRENIVRQFNTNVIGLLDVTRAVLPHFRANRSGVVVNISSMGGKTAFPLGSLYHGTKYAVEGITEALSFELEQLGCKAKLVEPGMIKTDFGGRSLDFTNDESMTEYQETVTKLHNAMGTLAANPSEPELVAEVIYEAATDGTNKLRYLAGEDAKMIIAQRNQVSDDEFLTGIKTQFNL